MSVDTSDVAALLPADRRVGDVTVVDLSVGDDVDGDGEDVLVVTLTLAPPSGETWSPGQHHAFAIDTPAGYRPRRRRAPGDGSTRAAERPRRPGGGCPSGCWSVTARPLYPEDLIWLAHSLAGGGAGPGRPRAIALRRAVSSAYYAMFHEFTWCISSRPSCWATGRPPGRRSVQVDRSRRLGQAVGVRLKAYDDQQPKNMGAQKEASGRPRGELGDRATTGRSARHATGDVL